MSTRALLTAVAAVVGSTLLVSPSSADRHREIIHAKVVDVDPIIEVVNERIPHQICRDERVRVVSRGRGRPGAPGILGAVIGGTVAGVLAAQQYCRANGIRCYGGGQFELGPGRPQIQYLASLFHPDAPNDVAPGGYNAAEPIAGLASSPLSVTPAPAGFRLDREGDPRT